MRQCCHPTGGTVHLGSLIKSAAFGKGIAEDVHGRIPWYRHDWVDGYSYGIRRVSFHQCSFLSPLCASASCFLLTNFLLSRLLAPATYIFFASVIPALAFGQQLFIATGAVSLSLLNCLTKSTRRTRLGQSAMHVQCFLCMQMGSSQACKCSLPPPSRAQYRPWWAGSRFSSLEWQSPSCSSTASCTHSQRVRDASATA